MKDRELKERLSMRPRDYQRHIAAIQGRFHKVDETPTHIVVGLFNSLNFEQLTEIQLTHICEFYAGSAGENASHQTQYSATWPAVKNTSMYSGFILIEKNKPQNRKDTI